MIKTYSFKSTNNNNKKSAATTMNNMFKEKIFAFAPYLKKENKTKKTINIDITIPKKKTFNGISIDDFASACAFLATYNPHKYTFDTGKDEYDFELPDGTPVRFFDDEIQIGYDLIPLTHFTNTKYFDMFTPENKKIIIDIAVKLAA